MPLLKTRFSRNASRMGAGNPHKSPNRLSFSVFIRYRIKSGDDRKRLKWLKPTHSLPKIPLMGLYSVNAISTPPMGM